MRQFRRNVYSFLVLHVRKQGFQAARISDQENILLMYSKIRPLIKFIAIDNL